FEDTLASARRLWVRGQLVGISLLRGRSAARRRWWRRWWRKPLPASLLPPLHLETRISGQLLEADVPLQPNGRFEATFTAVLPVARRGWRIARNRVSWNGQTIEQCSVVVRPSEEARGVAIVILPLANTSQRHGAQSLARSEQAARLTPVLRRLHQGPGDAHALYYVACVPEPEICPQAELALATTTLGWPPGSFLPLPFVQDPSRTIAAGRPRLRLRFSRTRGLIILNFERAFPEPWSTSV